MFLSRLSPASGPHFDLYLISDPLAPPGAQMGRYSLLWQLPAAAYDRLYLQTAAEILCI